MKTTAEKIVSVQIEDKIIDVSNPDKLYWPEAGITKLGFIEAMTRLAPYMIKYTKDRYLTTIRFPHGINDKSFFQKNIPANTPEWVSTGIYNDINYILLNSPATLVWLCTQGAIEFHISFNTYDKQDNPSYLCFDLDPSPENTFDDVRYIALKINETLKALSIKSFIKTSGATGMQIYLPTGSRYNYDTARELNDFFAQYFTEKLGDILTIERIKNKRQGKVYFDWQQMWYGKSIIAPYSSRAVSGANVSMPLDWSEVENIKPDDFNLKNAFQRLEKKGDYFEGMFNIKNDSLDEILKNIRGH